MALSPFQGGVRSGGIAALVGAVALPGAFLWGVSVEPHRRGIIYPEIPIVAGALIALGFLAAILLTRGKLPRTGRVGTWLLLGAAVLVLGGAVLYFFPAAVAGADWVLWGWCFGFTRS